MKVHSANLLNAIALIPMGFWGYLSTGSPTAFISVAFGVILVLFNGGLRKENKVIAHVAVVLTLLVLFVYAGSLLPKALAADDTIKLIRTIIPIGTGVVAMVAFVKSFIAAKKARKDAAS